MALHIFQIPQYHSLPSPDLLSLTLTDQCRTISSLTLSTLFSAINLPMSEVMTPNGNKECAPQTQHVRSVQFSRSVVSNSLWPHESQHARPPCPSPSPRVHSDSRPSSPWWHPAISSSVIPFSSCPQSLRAWESFPVNQLFTWGGQSTGASALASFLPK